MKMLIILMTLMTLIQSCRNPDSYPKLEDQEQLSPYLANVVEIDGEEYIPLKGSYCFSRVYRISKGSIGPINEAINLDIRECHKIVGRAPSEYGVFATWLENFRVWLLGF